MAQSLKFPSEAGGNFQAKQEQIWQQFRPIIFLLVEMLQHVLLFVLFCGSCFAQSGGGGSGGGLFAGIIAVVCCPCITVAAIAICIKSKVTARKEKKFFLGNVQPATGSYKIIPEDGKYTGTFSQASVSYHTEVDLHFHEKDDEDGVRVYKVKGKGHDEMGNFKIKKGECRVGTVGRVFFRKSYTSMKKGYSGSLYQLIYTGEILLEAPGRINGTWKFAGKEGGEPGMDSGSFLLQCETKAKTLEAEIDLGQTPGPPPAYLQTGINLEKTPLLP